jgi:uroporphyrin-III C-methyltransferase
MLFGRAQEEIAALEAAGVRYEVVPGVTAALAAAADLGTSLTQRGSVRSFAFVTPRIGVDEDPSRWVEAMSGVDAGAIYMGSREAPAVAKALIATGYAETTPVAIVEDASLPTSRVSYTTIAGLAVTGAASDAPTLLLVGPQFHARHRTTTATDSEIETLNVAAG